MLVADEGEGSPTRLLDMIEHRRRCVDAYVRQKSPASTRLSTISIVSSAVAAALTAGPALGGGSFAETTSEGLGWDTSEPVWRLLCLGALAVSVTAAISANLNKASDLTSRIAAAEAARAALHGLATRLEFGRLPVEDAALEYRDVLAGIPFVPDMAEEGTQGRERDPGVRGRLGRVSSLAALALAMVLLVAMLVGYVVGLTGRSPADGGPADTPAATPSAASAESSTSAPTPSSTAVAATGVFAGRADPDIALAVVISGAEASAYLCDGRALESWLRGRVEGTRLLLEGQDGTTLTGDVTDGSIVGQFSRPGSSVAFTAAEAPPPAGVYEAKIGETRIGWAVLPDGQRGVVNDQSSLDGAPELDMRDLSFEWEGTERTARPWT